MPVPTAVGLFLETAAFFLAFSFHLPSPPDPGIPRTVLAMLLLPLATAIPWSAVKHLGRQFRITAGLYHDHELVRTGVYSLVRHPIYASLMGMLVANILLLTRWPWSLIAFAVYIAGTEIRVRTEDGLLHSRFGAQFAEYRRTVPAYIPWVR